MPVDSTESQVDYSVAGRIASGLEVVVAPIGFNHDIALALIPAMAAREVAVSALATANAIEAGDDEEAMAQSLSERLQGRWSILCLGCQEQVPNAGGGRSRNNLSRNTDHSRLFLGHETYFHV